MNLVKDGIYEIETNDGVRYIAHYFGRQKDFECCVCRKGNNAYTFNIPEHQNNLEKAIEDLDNGAYETWGFGKEHFPKIIDRLK